MDCSVSCLVWMYTTYAVTMMCVCTRLFALDAVSILYSVSKVPRPFVTQATYKESRVPRKDACVSLFRIKSRGKEKRQPHAQRRRGKNRSAANSTSVRWRCGSTALSAPKHVTLLLPFPSPSFGAGDAKLLSSGLGRI